jgi:hypothetical protein
MAGDFDDLNAAVDSVENLPHSENRLGYEYYVSLINDPDIWHALSIRLCVKELLVGRNVER